MNKSFTLLELCVVLIIIGIVASMGTVGHNKAVEAAKLKQGRIMLLMLRDAQRAYYMRNGIYYTCTSATSCRSVMETNAIVNLDESAWTLNATNASPALARITRSGGTYSGCQYTVYLNANDTVFQSAGTCP